MEIKPGEIVKIGTVFALYGEQGELVIANRDKAVVEAALRAHKPRPKVESEQDLEAEHTRIDEALKEFAEKSKADIPGDEKEDALPDLDSLSYRELKAIAKRQGVPHYQRMKREDLQAAIEQLMTDTGVEDEGEAEAGPEF